jgi:hypothetical protein
MQELAVAPLAPILDGRVDHRRQFLLGLPGHVVEVCVFTLLGQANVPPVLDAKVLALVGRRRDPRDQKRTCRRLPLLLSQSRVRPLIQVLNMYPLEAVRILPIVLFRRAHLCLVRSFSFQIEI